MNTVPVKYESFNIINSSDNSVEFTAKIVYLEDSTPDNDDNWDPDAPKFAGDSEMIHQKITWVPEYDAYELLKYSNKQIYSNELIMETDFLSQTHWSETVAPLLNK